MLDWSKELESAKRDLEYLVEKEVSTKHLFVFSKLESMKPIEKTPEKREIASEETTPVPRGNSRIKPTEPVNLSGVFDVPLQVEDLKKETPVPGKKNAKKRPPLAPVGSLSLPEKEHVMMDVPEDYEYASSNRDQDNIENVERFEFKPPILFAEERKRWHNSLRSYRGNRGTRPLWGKGSSSFRSKKMQQTKKQRRLNKTPPYLNSLKDIKPRRGNRPADFVGWAAHDRRRYEAPSASFGAQNLIVTQDQNVSSKRFLRVKTNVENNQEPHNSTLKQDDDDEEEEDEEKEMKESTPDISMPPGLRSPRRRSISRDVYTAEISIPESIVLPDEDAKNLLVQINGIHDEKHQRGATSPKRGRRSPGRKSISRDAFVTNESHSIHLSREPTKEVALSSDIIHKRDDECKMKTVARRRSVSEKAEKPSEKSPQKHISESPTKGQGLSAAVPDNKQYPSIPDRAVVSRLRHEFDTAEADEKKHHRPSLHLPSRVVPEKRNLVKSDVEDVKKPSTLAEVTKLLRMARDRKIEKERKNRKIEKAKDKEDQKNTLIGKKKIQKSQDKPTRRRADHKDWKSKSSRRRGSYFGTYV